MKKIPVIRGHISLSDLSINISFEQQKTPFHLVQSIGLLDCGVIHGFFNTTLV
jgi:hypothetical protein